MFNAEKPSNTWYSNKSEIIFLFFNYFLKFSKLVLSSLKILARMLVFFFLRKLFQSMRLYIQGMLDGQPAPHCLANR